VAHVYQVVTVSAVMEESAPPTLRVIAKGTTRTSGFTHPSLERGEYVTPMPITQLADERGNTFAVTLDLG
jgi:hypothetical protein